MLVDPLGVILTGSTIGSIIVGGFGYLAGVESAEITGLTLLGGAAGVQMGFNYYVNKSIINTQ